MNYLAHAYLSFMHEDILIGNLISDFVKGKKKFDFSIPVQQGITLHRLIDSYTDEHPVTKEAKQFFKPAVGLYAGAFMDVVYDHFLALDKNLWKEDFQLAPFADYVYQTLTKNIEELPVQFQRILPYMKSQNWLLNYQYDWGIEKSFEGIVRRAVYLDVSTKAYQVFKDKYAELQQLSSEFIPDVKTFAAFNFQQLLQS